jgi:enoyl-CoA hydratase/carnithine racemase
METLLVERDKELPGLVTVTLNRPEKLNAINATMHRELQQLSADLRDDAEARVVLITGTGRAFSAVADLGRRSPAPAADASKAPPLPAPANPLAERIGASMGNRTSDALEGIEQVTIAAVNGLAVGGAVAFLACLDLRLAARSAWFNIPEVDLDIPMTWNSLPRFMREIGPARTKELVMTCDRFTAEQALQWGFVNHVVEDDELLPRARALAKQLLAKDPLSLALTKSTCNALARQMVPPEATQADRDYLMLARRVGAER